MYESPISLAIGEVSNEIVKKQDDMIFTEVTNMIGVQVDKDELLKALAYDRDQYDKGYQEGHIDGFAKAEKLYARPQWIPCSERLPDGCGELLITADYNGTLVTYSAWFNTLTNKFERVPQEHIVLAWMPVPEPYQEEGDI